MPLRDRAPVPAEGTFSSPLWHGCPRCGAYRGSPCDVGIAGKAGDGTYCEARRDANHKRLLDLPTYAIGIKTPCCGDEILLVWRTTKDRLEWRSVPCALCARTFAIENNASDLVDVKFEVPRLNPDAVEMTCWAKRDASGTPVATAVETNVHDHVAALRGQMQFVMWCLALVFGLAGVALLIMVLTWAL